jgi:hypothetical protein
MKRQNSIYSLLHRGQWQLEEGDPSWGAGGGGEQQNTLHFTTCIAIPFTDGSLLNWTPSEAWQCPIQAPQGLETKFRFARTPTPTPTPPPTSLRATTTLSKACSQTQGHANNRVSQSSVVVSTNRSVSPTVLLRPGM